MAGIEPATFGSKLDRTPLSPLANYANLKGADAAVSSRPKAIAAKIAGGGDGVAAAAATAAA
jgi:hypothetical protein